MTQKAGRHNMEPAALLDAADQDAHRFLAPGGLWDKSATSRNDPAEQHRHVARLCGLADDCMGASDDQRDAPGNPA